MRATNAKAVAEIGVWRGDFSKQILKACEFIEQYYMIDPWARLPDWNKLLSVDTQTFDDVYNEAMQKTAFASQKLVVLRGRTKRLLLKFQTNKSISHILTEIIPCEV